MIKGMAHVCFVAKDLEASIRFYCEGLGLTRAFDFRSAAGKRTGVYLHAGERTFIELFVGSPAGDAPGTSFRHICLEVDDVAAEVDRLRKRGVTVGDAAMGADQSWQAWLADPDGNKIELHGYTSKSRQAAYIAQQGQPVAPVVI